MLYLTVKTRDKILFNAAIDSVTSYNKIGTFDVLQDHSNFISIIKEKIIIKQSGATQEIPVNNGLLKVRENKIYVYLGIK